jgi:hypothetical protein
MQSQPAGPTRLPAGVFDTGRRIAYAVVIAVAHLAATTVPACAGGAAAHNELRLLPPNGNTIPRVISRSMPSRYRCAGRNKGVIKRRFNFSPILIIGPNAMFAVGCHRDRDRDYRPHCWLQNHPPTPSPDRREHERQPREHGRCTRRLNRAGSPMSTLTCRHRCRHAFDRRIRATSTARCGHPRGTGAYHRSVGIE